jgi:hypothetical protein
MAQAVNLQALITALAFKYVVEGRCTHAHIPDRPLRESERRQAFFGAAIGIPTFYVHGKTDNLFLLSILRETKRVRQSRRYPGYLRVQSADYRRALAETIVRDGADLIETMNLQGTVFDLRERLEQPAECSAFGRLTSGILRNRRRGSPLDIRAQEFNQAAERFYREELRTQHLDESLDILEEDLAGSAEQFQENPAARNALAETLRGKGVLEFFSFARAELKAGNPACDVVRRLIHLMLTLEFVQGRCSTAVEETQLEPAPVS